MPWDINRLTYSEFVQFREYANKRLNIE